MRFDPSRRAVLRAALGFSAYWGLGAATRPTVWARLPEIYDAYREPVTTAQIYRLRTGEQPPDLLGPGRAMWASRMEYLLYRISSAEGGVVPHVLKLDTGSHRAIAPGPCHSFAKAHSGARVYFVREGALWMQSMTAVFRGVERPQRVADLPAETGSGGGQIGVSPQEREVFLASGSGEPSPRLLAVDLASGEIRKIADLPAPAVDLRVSPYEDGRGVLMKSDRFGPSELVLAQLPDFTALPPPYERSVRGRRN